MDIEKPTYALSVGYLFALSLALLIPFSRAAISILTALILILWLISAWPWRTSTTTQRPTFILPITGYILFSALSLLWSQDLTKGIDDLGVYVYWLMMPALAGLCKDRTRNVFSFFLIGMAISQVLFWGKNFGFWTLRHGETPFMNHIEYGVFLVATILVLLTRTLSPNTMVSERAVYVSLLILTIVTLFTSTGFTGQVAFITTIPFAILLHYPIAKRVPTLLAWTLALFLLVFGATFLASPVFQKNVSEFKQATSAMEGIEAEGDVGVRVGLIIIGVKVFMQHALVGAGFGDNMLEFQRILKEQHTNFAPKMDNWTKIHLHNQYLEVATKTGLIGLLLFGTFFYFYFSLPIEDRELKILRTLLGVAYLAGFVGEPLLHKQFSTALFALFTGLFLAAAQQKNSVPEQ